MFDRGERAREEELPAGQAHQQFAAQSQLARVARRATQVGCHWIAEALHTGSKRIESPSDCFSNGQLQSHGCQRSIANWVFFATTPHPVDTSGARAPARRAPPPLRGGDQTHARASTRTARRTLAARRSSMVVQTVRRRPQSTASTSAERAASESCVPVLERWHGRPDAARDGPRGIPKAGPHGGEWLF